MVHTFQLRSFLSRDKYEDIRKETRHGFTYQKGNGYISTQYAEKGINKISLKKYMDHGRKVTYYYIDFIINLSVLLCKDNASTMEIAYERNILTQGSTLNELVIYSLYNHLFELFPQLNLCDYSLDEIFSKELFDEEKYREWHIKNRDAFGLQEIDYTYDIPVGYVNTYMKLLNYGHQPGRIKRIRHSHEVGEDNLYEINGSVKINVYNKERELMERQVDEAIAKKHPVLRIEVALKRRKLSNMVHQKKYSTITERTLFDFANIDIGYEMVKKYMMQRCYQGHFFDYHTALQLIDKNDNIKPAMKSKLKEVIVGVKEYQGVDKYIEHAITEGKKATTIKKHIKRLEEIGINPVTISKRDKEACQLEGGGRFLPSIYLIIDKIYSIEKENRDYPEKAFEDYVFTESDIGES